MKLGATTSLCEACPPSLWAPSWKRRVPVAVGYRSRMLCPLHALDAIHADGRTLDEAIGCADE